MIRIDYDNQPDPKMGNLSPNQVYRLTNLPWNDPDYPIKFSKNLIYSDIKESVFFANTTTFLKTLIEMEKENTATAKGNLNRKTVKLLFDKLILEEDYKKFTLKYNKVINETDVFPLHIIRVVCESAGLMFKTKNRFLFSEEYHHLLAEERAGELYYLLFNSYFTKFDLGYLDRLPDLECIQTTLGYSLYRLSKVCKEYQKIEKLQKDIFLPSVLKEINKNPLLQRQSDWIVLSRIIRPLEGFGLVECRYKKKGKISSVDQVRKTELFDRFVRIGW